MLSANLRLAEVFSEAVPSLASGLAKFALAPVSTTVRTIPSVLEADP